VTTALFDSAPYHRHDDPLDRLLGYIDFRKELLKGSVPEFTCLVGTMVQEAFDSSPAIREACHRSIFGHSADVARHIEDAKKLYARGASWSAKSLALHVQAVIQGAFILAKAEQNAAIAAESIDHLRRYVKMLFSPQSKHSNRRS
jgi:TetR/AcrR family transcriptional regulator, transcriptional repressor for nem operon